MEQINLSIDFVSASAEKASQTGDPLSCLWILGIVALSLVGLAVFCKKQKINFAPKYNSNDNYGSENNRHATRVYLSNRTFFKVIAIYVLAILAISIFAIFTSRIAFGAPSGSDLTPDTDKITASVHDDGSITFSTCNLKNTSDKLITLDAAIVDVADEAKSVAAIHTCDLTINSFDGCIFKGMPNGQPYVVKGCSSLDVGESTPFALALTNLDRQSAMELCGKRVFTLKLKPQVSTLYNLATDGNGSWTEDGKTVTSFEVPGEVDRPAEGEIITYTGLDRKSHSVKATPNQWYNFDGCTFDSQNNTFTATFNTETYNIEYKDQGGEGFTGIHESGYPTIHAYGYTTQLKSAMKTGYTFDGWYEEQDCSGNKVAAIDAMTKQDVTLYAKWTINKHKVTFSANGHGTNAEEIPAQAYDSKITSPGTLTAVTGYTHDGKWYKESTCTTEWNFSSDTMPDNDLVLYAKWTANTYTVTYQIQGHGTTPSPSSKTVTYNSAYGALPTLSETGYTFGGWFLDSDCSDDKLVTEETIVETAENHNLYAKWLCTVEFDMNGHGTQVSSQSIAIGGTVSVPPNPETSKKKYEFAGWYKSNEFTEQNLYDFDTQVTSSFTLYARWKGVAEINFAYGESYDGSLSSKGWEGSTSEIGGVVYKYFDLGTKFTDVLAEWNDSVSGKVTAATKTGYNFDGFDINDEQKTQDVITDDETLWYIQWRPQTYNIEYYDKGGGDYTGVKDLLPNTHIYGTDTSLRSGEKGGYKFEGWFINSDCTGTKITTLGATSYTSDIKLYAKWTENTQKFKATVIKGDGEEFNRENMKGQNWDFDSSGNLYKYFGVGMPYSTILSEWGDATSWLTAPSITKEGMILTGFDPSSGSLTKDTEFHAKWTPNTEYNLTTDVNGVWKDESQKEVSSITVAPGESVPTKGEIISYIGTDRQSHLMRQHNLAYRIKKGSIATGKDADYLVFNEDLFKESPSKFSQFSPIEVRFAGKQVN